MWRLQLGAQLRQLRLACWLFLQAVAAAVGASETKISRMEMSGVGFKMGGRRRPADVVRRGECSRTRRVLIVGQGSQRAGLMAARRRRIPRQARAYRFICECP
ncbi:helix-turn-helix domain-containing protein [Streptomyces longwoodensis]|uniref:helix-turn-helix domain-containing protein n=1 Tax=Streptomyces longwoodensis TaxID=68231 RepID=UPI0033C90F24